MTNQTFDLNKCERNADGHYLCKTRGGLDAKVVYVVKDRTSHPLVAIHDHKDGYESLWLMTIKGTHYNDGTVHNLDLVNIPRTIKVERWINVYDNGTIGVYSETSIPENSNCFACKHIVFEVFEGEGL